MTIINIPAPNTSVMYPARAQQTFAIAFSLSSFNLKREKEDLLLEADNGETVVLANYFLVDSIADFPRFLTPKGVLLSGVDFLQRYNPTISLEINRAMPVENAGIRLQARSILFTSNDKQVGMHVGIISNGVVVNSPMQEQWAFIDPIGYFDVQNAKIDFMTGLIRLEVTPSGIAAQRENGGTLRHLITVAVNGAQYFMETVVTNDVAYAQQDNGARVAAQWFTAMDSLDNIAIVSDSEFSGTMTIVGDTIVDFYSPTGWEAEQRAVENTGKAEGGADGAMKGFATSLQRLRNAFGVPVKENVHSYLIGVGE